MGHRPADLPHGRVQRAGCFRHERFPVLYTRRPGRAGHCVAGGDVAWGFVGCC